MPPSQERLLYQLQDIVKYEDRLAWLIRMSQVVVPSLTPAHRVRSGWVRSWKSRSPAGKSNCQCCRQNKAQCHHHIIAIRNGGKNIPGNVAPLCDWCHEDIHPWLAERPYVGIRPRQPQCRVDRLRNFLGK